MTSDTAKGENVGEGYSVSEDSAITIPLRNLLGLIGAAGIVVMGYFQLTERITMLERDLHLANRYIEQNSEFRTKWPLGELGALPDDMMQNAQIAAMQEKLTALKNVESDLEKEINHIRLNMNSQAAVNETQGEKIQTLFDLWNSQIVGQPNS